MQVQPFSRSCGVHQLRKSLKDKCCILCCRAPVSNRSSPGRCPVLMQTSQTRRTFQNELATCTMPLIAMSCNNATSLNKTDKTAITSLQWV